MSGTRVFLIVIAFLVVVIGIISLSPTANRYYQIHKAEAKLAATMRDPESVKFRESFIGPLEAVCGEYNAKNGFGAYFGYQRFMVHDDYVNSSPDSDMWNLYCKDRLEVATN